MLVQDTGKNPACAHPGCLILYPFLAQLFLLQDMIYQL